MNTSIPIHCLTAADLPAWLAAQPKATARWVEQTGFKAKEHTLLPLPDAEGNVVQVLCGLGEKMDMWSLSHLLGALPGGTYVVATLPAPLMREETILGALLADYAFTAYKTPVPKPKVTLLWPAELSTVRPERMAKAIFHGRDLINHPANAMGPADLEKAARAMAERLGMEAHSLVGQALLDKNYPTIHMVGRAAAQEPRLIDLRWGPVDAPKVTLVGKGVTFDTGGLDIKSSGGMKLMKKDMGGAAAVLSLAEMIVGENLPIRLRVLVPAVENSVSGNAMRPLDIVRTRKGLTVEVGNTDAEGRLILCDALAEADSEKPELIVDCATLTGAARTALGTDIPAFFTPDDALADEIMQHSRAQADPLWRLPLWEGYRDLFSSPIADMNNISDGAYAGAIIAALFLKTFVETKSWVHIDMMAWNVSRRPGRPAGGEMMAIRALLSLLRARYGR